MGFQEKCLSIVSLKDEQQSSTEPPEEPYLLGPWACIPHSSASPHQASARFVGGARQGEKPTENNPWSVSDEREGQHDISWKMQSLSMIEAQSKWKQQSETRPACNL